MDLRTSIAAIAIVAATGTMACGKGNDCKAFRDAVGDTEHDLGNHGSDLKTPGVPATVQKEIAALVDRVKAATIKDKEISERRDDYVKNLQDLSLVVVRMQDPKNQADTKTQDSFVESYQAMYQAVVKTRENIRGMCE